MDLVTALKPYQRVNHFPAMNEISRKDLLAKNFNRYFLRIDFSVIIALFEDYRLSFPINTISFLKRGYFHMTISRGTSMPRINAKSPHRRTLSSQRTEHRSKGEKIPNVFLPTTHTFSLDAIEFKSIATTRRFLPWMNASFKNTSESLI
jgi:hypothetical protein